jgi:hypothetical protein
VELLLAVSLAHKGEAKVSLSGRSSPPAATSPAPRANPHGRLRLTPQPGKNKGRIQLSDED